MPPKKYTMNKLDKKFDEKLSSFKFDLVSDLKKEIMNEIKAILREKDKGMEDLKSQVTLLQNHVSTVKHAMPSIKKLMNWSSMVEGFASALKVLNIKLTKNLRMFWRKL